MAKHTYRDPSTGRFARQTPPVPKSRSKGPAKVHAGIYVHDEAYDTERHDCGPWMEAPSSSRIRRYRFDYMNEAVQVQWYNGNMGYIYLGVPYEIFRAFTRSASKGKFINSTLNLYEYRPMTPEEVDAPSNERRKALATARP